jgi:hypothetical protein
MTNFTPGSEKGRKVNLGNNHRNVALFIKALITAPMTRSAMAEFTGMHRTTIDRLIFTLKAEDVVHICDWKADSLGRMQTPIYSVGGGIDAEKPKRVPMSLRSEKYRRKMKAKNEPVFEPKTKFVGGSLWG